MDGSTTALLAGLGGAIIGAAAALGAQWLAIRHDRKAERGRELVELTARLWECADRLWRASQGLEHAVIGLTGSERSESDAVRSLYEQRRQESMRQQHEAEAEGRFVVGQMRLRKLVIHNEASELLDASVTYDHQQRDQLRERRDRALALYEGAAQQLLDKH